MTKSGPSSFSQKQHDRLLQPHLCNLQPIPDLLQQVFVFQFVFVQVLLAGNGLQLKQELLLVGELVFQSSTEFRDGFKMLSEQDLAGFRKAGVVKVKCALC